MARSSLYGAGQHWADYTAGTGSGARATEYRLGDEVDTLLFKGNGLGNFIESCTSRAQLELPRPSFEKGGLTMIGSMLTFVLRIKAEDKDHDLALITSEDNQAGLQKLLQGDQFMVKYYDVHPLPVKLHSTRVVDGDEIIAVGFPLGETSPISSSGHIASAWSMENLVNANETGSDKSTEVYTLDLRINPGNSGGPLFLSQDMSVIGIIVELKNGPGGIAKAVRSSYIEKFLTDNKVSSLKSPPSAP